MAQLFQIIGALVVGGLLIIGAVSAFKSIHNKNQEKDS